MPRQVWVTMTLESKVEREACDLVYNNLGIANSKLVTPGDTGYPDRIFWLPGGKPFLIEFKQPGKEARVKQAHIHKLLRKLGYLVEVHDDPIDAFEAVINAVDSPRLSKEGRKILARARSLCVVLRSGSR